MIIFINLLHIEQNKSRLERVAWTGEITRWRSAFLFFGFSTKIRFLPTGSRAKWMKQERLSCSTWHDAAFQSVTFRGWLKGLFIWFWNETVWKDYSGFCLRHLTDFHALLGESNHKKPPSLLLDLLFVRWGSGDLQLLQTGHPSPNTSPVTCLATAFSMLITWKHFREERRFLLECNQLDALVLWRFSLRAL